MSSDMLREVSESLFEFLIEAFPTHTSYTRRDIEQDPMPPLLAHFLGQTLQYRLDVELEHLGAVRSTWFDYDHPDVQYAYKQFVASLAQYAQVPSEEWRSTLKRATKLVIAHLILPTHTLVEFVFREEDGSLAAPVVFREISYFAAYPYLREAVETFLKKRELKEIDRTRFSSLLTQVDRHMTMNYTVDQWMRMLRPLFDLMRRVPQTNKEGVPIDLLSMFFGDKEAYDIQGRLQVEKEVHRITYLDEIGLRRVIEGSVGPYEQELTSSMPAASVVEEKPKETVTSYMPVEDAPPPKKPEVKKPEPEVAAANEAKPKPIWERFQKSIKEKVEGPFAEKQAAEKQAAPAEKEEDSAVPLWMRFRKNDQVPVSEHLRGEDGAKSAESASLEGMPTPTLASSIATSMASQGQETAAESLADSLKSESLADSLKSEPLADSLKSEPLADSLKSEPEPQAVTEPLAGSLNSKPLAGSVNIEPLAKPEPLPAQPQSSEPEAIEPEATPAFTQPAEAAANLGMSIADRMAEAYREKLKRKQEQQKQVAPANEAKKVPLSAVYPGIEALEEESEAEALFNEPVVDTPPEALHVPQPDPVQTESPEPESVQTESPQTEPVQTESTQLESLQSEASQAKATLLESLQENFQQENTQQEVAEPEAPVTSPAPVVYPENAAPPPSPFGSKEAEPLFDHTNPYANLPDNLSPLEQLEYSVLGTQGTSNRQIFIEHLFAGGQEDYEQMLYDLDRAENWEEASRLVAEGVFRRFHVNIYSPAAITFTESIEEQYNR